MKNNFKILATILMHSIFFIIAAIIFAIVEKGPAGHPHLRFEFIGVVLFSIVQYWYLWKKLYSKSYHIYLKGSFSISVLSISFFLTVFFLAELVLSKVLIGSNWYTGSWDEILLKYALFGLVYLFMILLQFLWIVSLARHGFFRKNTLIIGQYDKRIPLENLFQDLYGTKNCVGHVIMKGQEYLFRGPSEDEFKLLDEDFMDFLLVNKVNEMILCMNPDLSAKTLNKFAAHCREQSLGYYLISDIRKLLVKFPWDKRLNSIPIIEHYSPNRDSIIMVSVKRIADMFCSAIGLVLLSPVFLFISAGIVLTDGFPVIYRSTRIGIHGKPIKFYKFRTMVKNAEALKDELLKYNERPDGPLFKMDDDPRVTKVGQVLRRLSLDELPQLWNVLRGDMSLIGPRPHLPEEVKAYTAYDHLRLECIPGISCLPQIRGRNDLGFREWVDLDLEYRKNWTMLYDVKILWETAGVVLRPIFNRKKG